MSVAPSEEPRAKSQLLYYSPVTRWTKRWQAPPESSGPMVTLGARPGNTSKPPPNHFQLYKWVPNPDAEPILLNDEPLPGQEDDQMVRDASMDLDEPLVQDSVQSTTVPETQESVQESALESAQSQEDNSTSMVVDASL